MGLRLLTALSVCAALAASAAVAQDEKAAKAAFLRAEKIIKDHRLLTPKAQACSTLLLRDDSDARTAKVGVYEVHDAKCGGDPDVSHRLFDLDIDMKTGAARWDNNPDMEMRPVPKRGR